MYERATTPVYMGVPGEARLTGRGEGKIKASTPFEQCG